MNTNTTTTTADPYHLSTPACDPSAHNPRTGRQRKTCVNSPHCLFGLGEFREGIWKDQHKSPCASMARLSHTVVRNPATPLGLRNLGATCYVGSLLQALFMNQAFRKTVLTWRCASTQGQETKSELQVLALQRLFVELELSSAPQADPSDLAKHLELQTAIQQDAQEFNKLLLTHLDNTFSSSSLDKKSLTSMFRGSLEYVTLCSSCNTRSAQAAEFYELELQISGMKTVSQCLESFTRPETLDGPNQYQCETCRGKRNATRRIMIKELPEVLSLQMMRFVFDATTFNKKKLKDAIEIPQHLVLSASNGKEETYMLTAILYHRGNSAHAGHYVADVLDTQGVWWTFNDEIVERMVASPSAESEVVLVATDNGTTHTLASSVSSSSSSPITSSPITSVNVLVNCGVLHVGETIVLRDHLLVEIARATIIDSTNISCAAFGQFDDVAAFYVAVMSQSDKDWLQRVWYQDRPLSHLLASMSGVDDGSSALHQPRKRGRRASATTSQQQQPPKQPSRKPKKSTQEDRHTTKRAKIQPGEAPKAWTSKDAYMLVYHKASIRNSSHNVMVDARKDAPQHMVEQVLADNNARTRLAQEMEQRKSTVEKDVLQRRQQYQELFQSNHSSDDNDDDEYWIPTQWLMNWIHGEKISPVAPPAQAPPPSKKDETNVIDLCGPSTTPHAEVIDLVKDDHDAPPLSPLYNDSIPNHLFVCAHNKLHPNNAQFMKLVSERVWKQLSKPNDLALPLSRSMCSICASAVMDRVSSADMEMSMLQQLIDIIELNALVDKPVADKPVADKSVADKPIASENRPSTRSNGSGGSNHSSTKSTVTNKLLPNTTSSATGPLVWVSWEWLKAAKEEMKQRKQWLLVQKEQAIGTPSSTTTSATIARRTKRTITDHFNTKTQPPPSPSTTHNRDANADIKCHHNRLCFAKKSSARAFTAYDWEQLKTKVRNGYWATESTTFAYDEPQCVDCERESRNMKELTTETRDYRNGLLKNPTFGAVLKALTAVRRGKEGVPPSSTGRLPTNKYAVVSRSWMEGLRAFLNGDSPDGELTTLPSTKTCTCEAHGLTILPHEALTFLRRGGGGGGGIGTFVNGDAIRQRDWLGTVENGEQVELVTHDEWLMLGLFLNEKLGTPSVQQLTPAAWIIIVSDDDGGGGMMLTMEPALCEPCQEIILHQFENQARVFSNKNVFVVRLSVGQNGAQVSASAMNMGTTAVGGGGGGQYSTRSTGRSKAQGVETSSHDTIQELKLKIYQKCTGLRCQPLQIRLWFQGHEVCGHDLTLEMVGIKKNDTVFFDTGGGGNGDDDDDDTWTMVGEGRDRVEVGFSGTALMSGGGGGGGGNAGKKHAVIDITTTAAATVAD